jgi:putative pyruvate formate lyase activating enzyme
MKQAAHTQALERARALRESLRSCRLCPRQCGADRLAGHKGYCGLDATVRWFKEMVYDHEESGLNPSHQVYFSGCNLRCAFCSVEEWNLQPQEARPLDLGELSTVIQRRRQQGARTLNLLGGEPAVSVHGILELLSGLDVRTIVVWNSNMYYSEPVARALDGLVDVYLADLKVGNPDCAGRLLGAEDYLDVVRANIRQARAASEVIVRHLILPGHWECCLRPTLEWLAREVPDVGVSLRANYVPPAGDGPAPKGYSVMPEQERALRIAGELALHLVE